MKKGSVHLQKMKKNKNKKKLLKRTSVPKRKKLKIKCKKMLKKTSVPKREN